MEKAGPYGELIGRGPVWGGFYTPHPPSHGGIFASSDAPRTHFGWRIKVLWVMQAHNQAPVTIEGQNVRTGAALWFEPSNAEAGPAAMLNPAQPGAPSENPGWLNFPSYLYFPGAGCFTLATRSAAGGWQMVFGFGR
jgi:hypothetical protein